MKRSTKVISIIIVFFLIIASVIVARTMIGKHFQKKFGKRPPPGIIVTEVVKKEFSERIETFGTAVSNKTKSFRIKKDDLIGELNLNNYVKKGNTIINLNSINKLCQQILYLINQNKNGIYHLGTYDLIYHDDLINKIIKRKFKNKAIFKFVYSSNTERYIATLPKENKLPKHLNISCNQVINSLSIKRSF